MQEMMIDLETLDVKNSAVVLSIGAVVWEPNTISYYDPETQEEKTKTDGVAIVDRFFRAIDIDEQVNKGRTVSLDTIRFWMDADPTAREEAFDWKGRSSVKVTLADFYAFGLNHHGITSFWAKPATFDFPIWDDLRDDFGGEVPWRYNQKYDVRTVVKEASYSADGHDYSKIVGVPHTPVYDCLAQIDLLYAARVKLGRRLAKK